MNHAATLLESPASNSCHWTDGLCSSLSTLLLKHKTFYKKISFFYSTLWKCYVLHDLSFAFQIIVSLASVWSLCNKAPRILPFASQISSLGNLNIIILCCFLSHLFKCCDFVWSRLNLNCVMFLSAYGYNHLLHWLITLSWDILTRLHEKTLVMAIISLCLTLDCLRGFCVWYYSKTHLMLLFDESSPMFCYLCLSTILH